MLFLKRYFDKIWFAYLSGMPWPLKILIIFAAPHVVALGLLAFFMVDYAIFISFQAFWDMTFGGGLT